MTKRCIVCDKVIHGSPSLVLMRTDGTLYAAAHAPALDAREDQGWFEIGPDCYRKVRQAGRGGFVR